MLQHIQQLINVLIVCFVSTLHQRVDQLVWTAAFSSFFTSHDALQQLFHHAVELVVLN